MKNNGAPVMVNKKQKTILKCSKIRKKKQEVVVLFIKTTLCEGLRFIHELENNLKKSDACLKSKLLRVVGPELTGIAAQYSTPVSKISPRSSLLLPSMKHKVNTKHPKMICDIPVQITWFALLS